jgi:hypothetical protein
VSGLDPAVTHGSRVVDTPSSNPISPLLYFLGNNTSMNFTLCSQVNLYLFKTKDYPLLDPFPGVMPGPNRPIVIHESGEVDTPGSNPVSPLLYFVGEKILL